MNGGRALRMKFTSTPNFDSDSISPGYAFLVAQEASRLNLSTSSSVTGNGSPLSTVHLLSLSSPNTTADALGALERCEKKKSGIFPFSWELKLHSLIESGRCPPVVCLEYNADPGFSLLPASHGHCAVILVYTSKALVRGQPLLKQTVVKQLVSSFHWNSQLGTAQFLLTEKLCSTCCDWFVTLCYSSKDDLLTAAGVSRQISSLKKMSTSALPGWRKRTKAGLSAVASEPSLLRKICSSGEGECGSTASWECSVAVGVSVVGVDILSPTPFPSPELGKVSLSVGDLGNTIVVTISMPSSPKVISASHTLTLPKGVVVGTASHIKMSRVAGLLCARFPIKESGESECGK